MTERTQRVDELLREEISRIVAREIEDPRVGFVTITRVEVSKDLRHGTVWASVIGTADERKATIARWAGPCRSSDTASACRLRRSELHPARRRRSAGAPLTMYGARAP
jgi:ribosome-binding factor A